MFSGIALLLQREKSVLFLPYLTLDLPRNSFYGIHVHILHAVILAADEITVSLDVAVFTTMYNANGTVILWKH